MVFYNQIKIKVIEQKRENSHINLREEHRTEKNISQTTDFLLPHTMSFWQEERKHLLERSQYGYNLFQVIR
jgi:hypothetical protein